MKAEIKGYSLQDLRHTYSLYNAYQKEKDLFEYAQDIEDFNLMREVGSSVNNAYNALRKNLNKLGLTYNDFKLMLDK